MILPISKTIENNNIIEDKIILLTSDDITSYFSEKNPLYSERKSLPSKYAEALFVENLSDEITDEQYESEWEKIKKENNRWEQIKKEVKEEKQNHTLELYHSWWLCSAGDSYGSVITVNKNGSLLPSGETCTLKRAIRPALWIGNT